MLTQRSYPPTDESGGVENLFDDIFAQIKVKEIAETRLAVPPTLAPHLCLGNDDKVARRTPKIKSRDDVVKAILSLDLSRIGPPPGSEPDPDSPVLPPSGNAPAPKPPIGENVSVGRKPATNLEVRLSSGKTIANLTNSLL